MRRTSSALLLALAVSLWGLACGPDSQGDAPAQTPLPESGLIQGEVFLSGAVDHAGTMIYCAGTNQVAFTDASGVYTFFAMPLGEYHLFARHDSHSESDLGIHRITAEDPFAMVPSATLLREAAEVLRLPEPALGAVSGRVTRGGGVSAGGISVAVLGSGIQTRTDEEGRWLLRDVTPGEQTIQFSAMGYQIDETLVTVLPDSLVEAPPVMLAPMPSLEPRGDRRIVGTVALVGPDGALERDHRSVRVILEGTSQTAVPDAQGRFEFTDLPPRVYRLFARADGYRDGETTAVDLREAMEYEITLFLDRDVTAQAETGSVVGTVALAGGARALGATVAVAGTNLATSVDASGRFSIEGIPAGNITLIAQAPQHAVLELPSVQVRAGETKDVGTLVLQRGTEPPRVIATTPMNGARDVLLLPEITVAIRFSAPMDAASVLAALEVDPDVPHSTEIGRGDTGADDDLLLIRFPAGEDGLEHRDRVQVRVGGDARSSEGVPMGEPHALRFTLGEPELYASSPPDGSSGHPSDREITLRFNAQLRTDEIDTAFAISPRPTIEPRLVVESDPQTGWTVIRIDGRLTPNQDYTLRLSNRLRTRAGQRLGGAREIQFTTAPQIVTDQYGQPVPRDDSVIY